MLVYLLGLDDDSSQFNAKFQPIQTFNVFQDEIPPQDKKHIILTKDQNTENTANKENMAPSGAVVGTTGRGLAISKKKQHISQNDIGRVPLGMKKQIKKRVIKGKLYGRTAKKAYYDRCEIRLLNQKAKELTELPLADISAAYKGGEMES